MLNRVRPFILWSLVALLTLWAATATAQTPAAGALTGQMPASGGIALTVWSGGNADALAGTAEANDCLFRAVWVVEQSTCTGWLRGAPALVN